MDTTFKEFIEKIKAKHEESLKTMKTEKNAGFMQMLFPEWEVGIEYVAGRCVRYNGTLYKVLVDHKTEEGMEPDTATDKFSLVKANNIPQ